MISYLVSFISIFAIVMMSLASYFDIRTREVPDFISYVMIAGGLLINAAISVTSSTISNLIFLPLAVLLLFGFSYTMYTFGQWGGGDVKLMLGLSMIFTSLSLYSNFSFVALFINMLIFGGLYGIIGTVVYGAIKIKKLSKFLTAYDIPFVIAGASAIIVTVLFMPAPFNFLIAFSAFLLVSMRYIYVIAQNLMFMDTPVGKLTEGDWLADDIKDDSGRIIVRKRPTGLVMSDIRKLKEHKIKAVLVKVGLPFVPGLLFGVAITLLFGNPLLHLVMISSTL